MPSFPSPWPRRPLVTLALLSLCILAGAPPTALAEAACTCPGPAAPSAETPINVNTASVVELQRLPRIGPARAQAIVRMRERLGGFKRPSQLLRVQGIGRATLRGLMPLIRLVDPPPDPARGTRAPDPVR